MATSAPPAKALEVNGLASPAAARSNPLVFWHLLSLDAPTVAALWTWFVARANNIHLPATSILAMAIAVWLLYAADRLLDTRTLQPDRELEERHYFHRANSRAFILCMVSATIVLAALLPHLSTPSVRLYLLLGSLLSAYFILIHSSSTAGRLPKELAVGVFFSAATFIPTVSRQPGLRLALLPAAILFAVLCSLNCLFIYRWENPIASPSAHPATRQALRFLPGVALFAAAAGLALAIAVATLPPQVPAACALSAVLLLLLHSRRSRLSSTTLRAAADLCLLTPILFIPLLNPMLRR